MSLTRFIKFLIIVMLLPAFVHAEADKEFIVMIDPGHGGKDAGALGLKTNEKSINLAVSKKLRNLLNSKMKDAKVEMTRDGDYFVTLKERPDMANRKHADIFVSIHANSVDKKSPLHNTICGSAVYTLGLRKSDTNLSLAMRENGVIKLEPDYTTTYAGFDPSSAESYIAFEMMQHSNIDQSIALAEAVQNELVRTAGRKNHGVRQEPFWVLVGTTMPAILVELDFICNPAMEKFMASEQGQDKLALAIYKGIERYRRNSTRAKGKVTPTMTEIRQAEDRNAERNQQKEEKSSRKESREASRTKADKDRATAGDEIIYKVQFLTSPTPLKKNDSRLKGLKDVDYYKDGKTCKYTTGAFRNQADASARLKQVKKLFPDAFVIKTRDGKRIK
ncbi:MAG: N-acetylmuramoyl-L-alanine amidase [Bacteroides sp.]|nr:N-acetylmuramoyl-L-alanine amidase [Bacteroides sp.]